MSDLKYAMMWLFLVVLPVAAVLWLVFR